MMSIGNSLFSIFKQRALAQEMLKVRSTFSLDISWFVKIKYLYFVMFLHISQEKQEGVAMAATSPMQHGVFQASRNVYHPSIRRYSPR